MLQQPPDPEFVLRGCDNAVTSLSYGRPDSGVVKHLLSGTQSGSVYLWDLKTWRPVTITHAHENASVIWIHQHPLDTAAVLTQGRDGKINIWDFGQSSWIKTESIDSTALGFCTAECMTLNNTACVAIPAESQSKVDLVSLTSKERILSLVPREAKSYGMCMGIRRVGGPRDEDHPLVLTGYEDGSIVLWDTRKGQELSRLKCHDETVMAFDFQAGLNKGVSSSSDHRLVAWTLQNTNSLMKLKEIDVTNPGIGCVCFRPDGKLLVTGGWDGRARVFSSKKLRPLVVLNYHRESVQCVAFSLDGALAVGSKDKYISCWNVYR